MGIPPTTRDRIVKAMATFDLEKRSSADWVNWEGNQAHRHAIALDGQIYPVKEIIALATGQAVGSFSGGPESNDYISNLGFTIEPLHLPTESTVQIALHECLLMRAPEGLRPSDAYTVVADRLKLPDRLRHKLMESGNENHWHNRVRFARRKLVDANVIDPAEHGQWRLRLRDKPTVWVEKCLVKGRPDRQEGEHALGRALWSPTRGEKERDVYKNMRSVQPHDLVLHLVDNAAIAGVSLVEGFARSDFRGIIGTNWAGAECYRIQLHHYTALDPQFLRNDFLANPSFSDRFRDIRGRYSNLFYDPNLQLHQGGYLTEAPPELVQLLNEIYKGTTGRDLVSIDQTTVRPSIMAEDPSEFEPKHIWLYAPGNHAERWEEFRDESIARIGWDEVGDLSELNTRNEIKAKMDEVYGDEASMVDASQLFGFAHKMQPGDWVFVKKGCREIVGFGIVGSSYRFDSGRLDYPHRRDVQWQKSGSWQTKPDRRLAVKTLSDITTNIALVAELEEMLGLKTNEEPLAQRAPPYTIEDFQKETSIPMATLAQWERRFRRKQHVILQGPPGTGKTFVAERLARRFISETIGCLAPFFCTSDLAVH